jgi:hypothetical protein
MIIMLILSVSRSPPEAMDANFAVHNIVTNRNDITEVPTIRVKYRYKSFEESEFPSMNSITDTVIVGMMASEAIPENTPWEDVARDLVSDIYNAWNMSGVSIQIETIPDEFVQFTKGYIFGIDEF